LTIAGGVKHAPSPGDHAAWFDPTRQEHDGGRI
jgi:hypothetical protein